MTNACYLNYFVIKIEDKCEWNEFNNTGDNTSDFLKDLYQKVCKF